MAVTETAVFGTSTNDIGDLGSASNGNTQSFAAALGAGSGVLVSDASAIAEGVASGFSDTVVSTTLTRTL